MFTTLVSFALFSSLAVRGVVGAGLEINSPALTECQEAHISWSGGEGPYNLIVVPSDAPCETVLADLGDHTVNSLTWKANLTAGTQVQLSLQDNTGDEAWSQNITVAKSTDASCLIKTGSTPSNTSSPTNATAKSASTPESATTLVVGKLNTPAANAESTPSSAPAVPVGAANAGINPLGGTSGALTLHKLSGTAILLSAFAAALAVF